MKKWIGLLSILTSTIATADVKHVFSGSDTLAGVVVDAIISSGLDQKIQYAGGGSGMGEKGLIAGDQGIAPLSREIKPEVLQQLGTRGASAEGYVLGLDGLSVFVKGNNTVASLDIATVARIYTCEITKWEQIPNSGMTGQIAAYRRNDSSGTTDAFKHFTGVKNFGSCVTALNETADIADITSRNVLAVGYSGLSGKTEQNRSVALSAKPGMPAVMPTTSTIRDFSYPMARKLYIYEIGGSQKANEVEQTLMSYIKDRSFMDPIMQSHEFITLD